MEGFKRASQDIATIQRGFNGFPRTKETFQRENNTHVPTTHALIGKTEDARHAKQ